VLGLVFSLSLALVNKALYTIYAHSLAVTNAKTKTKMISNILKLKRSECKN